MTIKADQNVKKSAWKWGALLLVVAIAAPVGYFAGRARAAGIPAVTPLIYSGVLTDAAGTPMTGSVPIQLGVFDAATAGNLLCVTPSAPQALTAGAFQVTLPDTCTPVVRGKADLWVEIGVSGVPIGRTKLGAVPYAVVAAEVSCGPTTGIAMVDTGAGFCMDVSDRTEMMYATSIGICAGEGKIVCSYVQLCTASVRSVGALSATANYRVSDLMFYSTNLTTFFGGGGGANPLNAAPGCAIAIPGPVGGPAPYRCCRGKG